MRDFLFHYHGVAPTTWVYLSSLLMIGLFFKFGRFWSVRNLDLMLLILLAPGLLLVLFGEQRQPPLPDSGQDVRSGAAPIQGAADGHAPARSLGSTQPSIEPSGTAEPLAPGPTATADPTGSDQAISNLGETTVGGALASSGSQDKVPAVEAASPGTPETGASPEAEKTRGLKIAMYGYIWLFCVGGLLLVRLLADPTMVRRPFLEPNLSAGGLAFIGCSLFVFLMANVIAASPERETGVTISSNQLEIAGRVPEPPTAYQREGPGYALLPRLTVNWNKALAIFSHLTIVLGMTLIAYWHFDSIVMGMGAAALYLMLPYTSLKTGDVVHALPAALLVLAVLMYRRPAAAGVLLGLASGFVYYPFFLLPLWCSFYWRRGLVRFLTGLIPMLLVLSTILVFLSHDVWSDVTHMFGLKTPEMDNLGGIWNEAAGGWSAWYRLPVLAAFLVLVATLALWPAQKNFGTLLSCSAAVMVATQFWHGYGGGQYMAWYLPLYILTIFRPNLEDRVAVSVIGSGWLSGRRRWLRLSHAA